MEHSYIEEFKGSEAVEGFYYKFIYGIVKSRDKSFALDLKLLFVIMDCFLGQVPPLSFFIVKLVCFISFPRSSCFIFFTIPLCMMLS